MQALALTLMMCPPHHLPPASEVTYRDDEDDEDDEDDDADGDDEDDEDNEEDED